MERICSGTPQSRPSTLKAVLWSLPFSLCKSPFPSFLLLGLVKYLQHTCFRAQFLLHCTGCLLNMEFLRINFKVASIQKKGVTEFICCNLDFYRLSPHNYQHHISSHLVSHHCLTVFLHLVPPRSQEQSSPKNCLSERDTKEQEFKSLSEDLYRLHLRLPVLASGTTSDNNPANLARTVRAEPSTFCHMRHFCMGPQGKCCPCLQSINSRIIHFSQ